VIRAVHGEEPASGLVFADAPPGATCPTVEALRDSDLVVLAAEPTPFGLHDLQVAVELCKALGLPCCVVINRADLGNDEVERYCQRERVPVLAHIPYDREMASAGARGIALARESPAAKGAFARIARDAMKLAEGPGGRP
jgi:MinD superfamily P-loop ATPase